MAINLNRIEIDIKIRHYGYGGADAPSKESKDCELILTEENSFLNLNVREAIKKLVDYIANY